MTPSEPNPDLPEEKRGDGPDDQSGEEEYRLAEPPPGGQCPACRAPMADGAILCIECGYNVKLGRRVTKEEALEHARKACERSGWDDANWLDALAKAYAESGDYAQATQWQQRAVEKIDDFLPFQRDACKKRLEQYKAGQPFREERWRGTSKTDEPVSEEKPDSKDE